MGEGKLYERHAHLHHKHLGLGLELGIESGLELGLGLE
jgi:hypothetical protein